MGKRRKLISAVFTAAVIAIAFRILNDHDSAGDYLHNGAEGNVKEISKIIIELYSISLYGNFLKSS